MHIVQEPTPGIPAEIEVDFLGRTEVKEFGDCGLSILAASARVMVRFVMVQS